MLKSLYGFIGLVLHRHWRWRAAIGAAAEQSAERCGAFLELLGGSARRVRRIERLDEGAKLSHQRARLLQARVRALVRGEKIGQVEDEAAGVVILDQAV